jgi:hypothetical protein
MNNKEIVRRAIHAVFGHLSDDDIARLAKGAIVATHAGAQLGTASQVKASGEMDKLARAAVDAMPAMYHRQIALYLTGEAVQ